MKLKAKEIVFLVFLLSACAPNATGGESWGKSVFSPSPSTERIACDAGFRYGKNTKQAQSVGSISFRTSKGIVGFSTKLGRIYEFCNNDAFIFDQNTSTNFSKEFTDVFVGDDDLIKDLKRVDILLLDDSKSVLKTLRTRLISSNTDSRRYIVSDFTQEEIVMMDKATSFAIILNSESTIVRYEVDQRMQPYGPLVYMSSSTPRFLEYRKPLTNPAIVERK